jgi:hypothetical protein
MRAYLTNQVDPATAARYAEACTLKGPGSQAHTLSILLALPGGVQTQGTAASSADHLAVVQCIEGLSAAARQLEPDLSTEGVAHGGGQGLGVLCYAHACDVLL